MPNWLSDPSIPAWVQAGGAIATVLVSVVTVFVAVLLPARQRTHSLHDANVEHKQQQKERVRRLVVGLRAEIIAAREAANRRQFAIAYAMKELEKALHQGAEIGKGGPIQPGSMLLTEAIIYRQTAAELGRLPPTLIDALVRFYTFALETGRIVDGASDTLSAYSIMLDMAPRVKMDAGRLIRTLDKFEEADFAINADLNLLPEELLALADEAGYPIEKIAKERGMTLPVKRSAVANKPATPPPPPPAAS